jgi:hypothetical protein
VNLLPFTIIQYKGMGMREVIIRMKLVGFSKGDILKKMGIKWGLINYFSTYIHRPHTQLLYYNTKKKL